MKQSKIIRNTSFQTSFSPACVTYNLPSQPEGDMLQRWLQVLPKLQAEKSSKVISKLFSTYSCNRQWVKEARA